MRRTSLWPLLAVMALVLTACEPDAPDQAEGAGEASTPPIDVPDVDFVNEIRSMDKPEPEPAPVEEPVAVEEPATPPKLEVSRSSLDLGAAMEGEEAEPVELIAQNTGEEPLRIFNIQTRENSVTVENACPPVIAPLESCSLFVRLRTDVPDETIADYVEIDSNAMNGVAIVQVTGAVFKQLEGEVNLPPSYEELLMRERARRLGEARQASLRTGYSEANGRMGVEEETPPRPRPTVHMLDEDYRKHSEIAAVEATFPVDNCRILPEGTRINVTLDTSILNEQESPVRGVVWQNVVSPCGNILVPGGSVVLGTSFAAEETDESRIMVLWHRILRAKDNSSIVFEGATSDGAGRGGVPGIVHARLAEKYGLTAALVGMSALISFLTPTEDTQASAAGADAQQKFGQLTAQELESKIDTKPIIEGAKGSMLQVIAHMQDIYFPAPEILQANAE